MVIISFPTNKDPYFACIFPHLHSRKLQLQIVTKKIDLFAIQLANLNSNFA